MNNLRVGVAFHTPGCAVCDTCDAERVHERTRRNLDHCLRGAGPTGSGERVAAAIHRQRFGAAGGVAELLCRGVVAWQGLGAEGAPDANMIQPPGYIVRPVPAPT